MDSDRLQALGAGVGCAIRPEQDLPLIEMGVRAADSVDRGWAYLAVEKAAHCPTLLNREFIDSVFPETLAAITGADPELARFAARGIGELSQYTDLLTPDQVAQAFDLAMTNLAASDLDTRGIALGLLDELLRNLSPAQMLQAFRPLFDTFEKWRQSSPVNDSNGTEEQRFRRGTVDIFLHSCLYVGDRDQAVAAFDAVTEARNSGQLEISALPSIAGLARALPTEKRDQAVDAVIAGLSDRTAWYDLGSGVHIPANYANDALLILEPILAQGEIQRALDAIKSQASNSDYQKVFGPTVERLNRRIVK